MQKIVIPVFFVFAIAFVSTLGWRPYPGDFVIMTTDYGGQGLIALGATKTPPRAHARTTP